MRFAIRDDDTSFFTKKDDLIKAYDFIEQGCVSLSLVPSSVGMHKDCIFPYGYSNRNKQQQNIEENKELIAWLFDQHKNGHIDILLHGYSHEYKRKKNKWCSEMIWKDKKILSKEIKEGKERIESLLECKITVFVAPNNHINSKGISIIENLKMNYSGTIGFFDRKLTVRYLVNFVKRWVYRLVNHYSSSMVFDYGKHKELQAYPVDNWKRLKDEFDLCKKSGNDFVVYTHYWKINNDNSTKELLKKIYNYAIENGAVLAPLSSLFYD